jgi:hypothetical protein
MYSIIVSISDEEKYNTYLLRSLQPVQQYLLDHGCPKLQIIKVSGTDSLGANYNVVLSEAKYPIKFFIHEDVDINDSDIPIFVQIDMLFSAFPNTSLIGLTGTSGNPDGWWWESPIDTLYGHVIFTSGETGKLEYFPWQHDKMYYNVRLIDGMFMATNRDLLFDENIKGFHLYDMDYSRIHKQVGFDVMVVAHGVVHHAQVKDLSNVDMSYYKSKWRKIYGL